VEYGYLGIAKRATVAEARTKGRFDLGMGKNKGTGDELPPGRQEFG